MNQSDLPDDWWPQWLQDLAGEDPLAEDPVMVAAIEPTALDYARYRHLFTALIPPRQLQDVLRHLGGIGHDVSASGPHPAEYRGRWKYTPRFWIHAAGVAPEELEPLVVSWKSANRSVLWPDQGFLMTYGLVPRLVQAASGAQDLHWDDPSVPRADVAVARLVSTYSFPRHSGARVTMAREYLQDYATIRGRALVQVYYAQRSGPLTPDVEVVLGGQRHVEFQLPGRLVDLRLTNFREHGEHPVLAQVWGVRPLLEPAEAPVSAGRWEYGRLTWPGIGEPITEDTSRRLSLRSIAYVCDSVLGLYEGRPEFSIHPESGGVSYGHQWSVSPTWRVGRDLIAVDLKKLYEGNRSDIVRHWHAHAVAPPSDPHAMREEPNVGTRARRIVYGLAKLGEVLAELASGVLSRPPASADFTGFESRTLDYCGWWAAEHVEPITQHIPLKLGRDAFLDRCSHLYQVAGECLNEALLRQTLLDLGIPADDLKEFRSLKLLDLLVRLSDLANRSGLRLYEDASALRTRLVEEAPSNPLEHLFALNALRQLADHRPGADSGRRRFSEALQSFGLDPAGYAAGWGTALDVVYDRINETLVRAVASVERPQAR